ncbi:PD-(D/E)XK nuclease family protein [uncultured Nonlabens sp.]|uniref:PD-(D/E)XK nuclease family protein n=1 Tax=uncultured Nonlabens sp. TaxID=859306 RepID=UPI0026116A5D|nr:PD-(D/E)XK nuclease family protein [uncultured Nonlabens sp.]
MNSFLEKVLTDLGNKNIDVMTATYVVPSRRVGIFLSRYLAQRIEQPVFLPIIYSVTEYIEKLSQVEIVNDLDLLPLFYKAYKSVETENNVDSFDEFMGWATTILKDFNEMDRYLVDPEQFFNYLGSVKEMDHWALNKNPTLMVSKYLRFWKKLHLYYNAFQQLCLENETVYQGMAYRLAFAKAEQLSNDSTATNKTIFLGLNALNTAESNIIQKLLEENQAYIYWDIDQYLMELPYHESGKFIRKFKKDWKYYDKNELNIYGNEYQSNKKIDIHGAAGNLSMIQVAVKLMKQIPQEELENTAIILADERLLLPLLDAIPDNIEHFNVTMGLSLDQLPLSAFVYDIIKMHNEASDDGYYYKGVVNILESSFAFVLIDSDSRKLVKFIKDNNLIYVTPSSFNEVVEGTIMNLIMTPIQNVGELIKLIERVLLELKARLLQVENRRLEIEQLLGITEVVQNLSTIVDNNEEIKDLKTVAYLYKQLVPLKNLDFIGEPVRGLQIMGLLETRALDYKNTIMLSVNEGILPAGKSTASYISNDMKYQFALPTYSEKDSVYAYHFYRLLHRVNHAAFIYNTEGDTLVGGEKSRFLTQLETDPNSKHIVSHQHYIFKNSAVKEELMVIEKEPSYFKRLQQIASSGFSPSALTSYVRNPIDFYASKILRISQMEDVEENIAANTMGSIIHEALDKLYQPYVNKILIKEDFDKIKKQIKPELDVAYQECYKSDSSPLGKNKIIYEVSLHYIKMMVQSDLDLVASGSELIIKSVERKLEAVIDVPEIGKVKIHGMVDRIDQLDGKLRIIDYKSGATAKGNVGIDPENFDIIIDDYGKAKAFQVLMYTYLYSHNEPFTEASAGIISFKNFDQGYIPFGFKAGRSYKEKMIDVVVLKDFEAVLFVLIKELFHKDIPLTEKPV